MEFKMVANGNRILMEKKIKWESLMTFFLILMTLSVKDLNSRDFQYFPFLFKFYLLNILHFCFFKQKKDIILFYFPT